MAKQIIERSIKQLNTHGNGVAVLVTREARSLSLKPGQKVQVTAIKDGDKEYIVVEKFPPKE